MFFYVYQDPIVAWSFVKKREALDGRRISKQVFISELFAAKNNVNQLKNKFGNRIIVHLLKKDYNNQVKRVEMNISCFRHTHLAVLIIAQSLGGR
jgi:hypothetical protein